MQTSARSRTTRIEGVSTTRTWPVDEANFYIFTDLLARIVPPQASASTIQRTTRDELIFAIINALERTHTTHRETEGRRLGHSNARNESGVDITIVYRQFTHHSLKNLLRVAASVYDRMIIHWIPIRFYDLNLHSFFELYICKL